MYTKGIFKKKRKERHNVYVIMPKKKMKVSKRVALLLSCLMIPFSVSQYLYASANCTRDPVSYSGNCSVTGTYSATILKGVPVYGLFANSCYDSSHYSVSECSCSSGNATIVGVRESKYELETDYYWMYTASTPGEALFHISGSGQHLREVSTGSNSNGGTNYSSYAHMDSINETYNFTVLDTTVQLALKPLTVNIGLANGIKAEDFVYSIGLSDGKSFYSATDGLGCYTWSQGKLSYSSKNYYSSTTGKPFYSIKITDKNGNNVTPGGITKVGNYTVTITGIVNGLSATQTTTLTVTDTVSRSGATDGVSYVPSGLSDYSEVLQDQYAVGVPYYSNSKYNTFETTWAGGYNSFYNHTDYFEVYRYINIPEWYIVADGYKYASNTYYKVSPSYNLALNNKVISPVDDIPSARDYVSSFAIGGTYSRDGRQQTYSEDATNTATYNIVGCTHQSGASVNYSDIRNMPGNYTIAINAKRGLFSTTQYATITVKPTLYSVSYSPVVRSFPWGTTVEQIIGSFNEQATLVSTDGTTTAVNPTNWTCLNFNSYVSNTYSFSTNLALPSGYTNYFGVGTGVSRNIVIEKPSITNFFTSSSPNKIDVNYGTSMQEAISKFDNKLTLQAEDGTTTNISLSPTRWSCANYDPTKAGTYEFNQTFTVPDSYTNNKGLSLVVKQIVEVHYPDLISVYLTDSTDIHTEMNVTQSNIQSRLSTTARLNCTGNYSDTVNVSSWTSTDYDPTRPGIYTFTSTITLPKPITNKNSKTLTVSRNVIVDNPIVQSISLTDDSNIHMEMNVPISNVQSALNTTATIVCNGNYSDTVNVSSWTSANYDPTRPGTYTFTSTIELPTPIVNTNNRTLIVSRNVIVDNPILQSIVIEDESDVNTEMHVTDISLQSQLSTTARLICSGSYSDTVTLNSWNSKDYDPTSPGRYTFTSNIKLPTPIVNTNNIGLEVTREVVVKEPTVSEVKIGRDGQFDYISEYETTVPYGTTKTVAISNLPDELLITLSSGEKINKTIDVKDIVFTPEYNGKIPQVYVGILGVNSYVPGYTDISNSTTTSAVYKVQVLQPEISEAKFINKNGDVIGDINNKHIEVEYNTTIDEVIKLLPTKIELLVNDGSTITKDISGAWRCDSYNKTIPKDYKFTHPIEFGGFINIDELDLDFTVTLNKPIYTNVEYDSNVINIDPIYTKNDVINMLPTTVKVYGTNDFVDEYALERNKWVLSTDNFKRAGVYGATYNYVLPSEVTSASENSVELRKSIVVGNPTVKNVHYAITTGAAITVNYGTPFEEARTALMKSVDVTLDDGEKINVPLSTDEWMSESYNGRMPGLYLAKNDIKLPSNVLNKENVALTIEQPIIVKERKYEGIQYENIPMLSFPYDTEEEEILRKLVTEVIINCSAGDVVTAPVDYMAWTSDYIIGNIPGNYTYTNSVMYVVRGEGDYSNSTTAGALDFQLTTPQSMSVSFNQNVAITNRKVVDIKCRDGNLPSKSTKYPYYALNDIVADLPKSFRLIFENGKVYDVTESVEWVQTDYERSSNTYTYTVEIPLPEYTVGMSSISVQFTLGRKTSDYVEVPTISVEPVIEKVPVIKEDKPKYNNVSFVVNDENWYRNGDVQASKLDVQPTIYKDRLCIPVRYVSYALNIKPQDVKWMPEDKVLILTKEDTVVQFTVGSNIVIVNGEETTIDAEPYIQDGRTMLPISQITKILLEDDIYSIKWNPETLEVKIVFDDQSVSDATDFITYDENNEGVANIPKDNKSNEEDATDVLDGK